MGHAMSGTNVTGEADLRLRAAETALRQGHAREALDTARAVLRTQPDHARAFGMIGLALTVMGEDSEAREAFGRAVALAPRDALLRFQYYSALLRLSDREGAQAQLTYFCRLEPGNAQAKAALEKLGGPREGLTPLPKPPSAAVWYDGGGHALAGAGDIAKDDADSAEVADGPDSVTCPACQKRTRKGWVCTHCNMPLRRP
jgi:tetratricopeptide (TPR) repeat protein